MDPGTTLNKRKRPPNDLAALRQKQLRKRQTDQSQSSAAQPSTSASSAPAAITVESAQPASLAPAGSFSGTLARRPPVNSLQASEPQFTLFGKAPSKPAVLDAVSGTADADARPKPRSFARQQNLNPFSNSGALNREAGYNDERPKPVNPFQRFASASKLQVKSPGDLNERIDNVENERVEVPLLITEVGFHVESALASSSRSRASASASDLPVRAFSRSYSCSSVLLSPRVKTTKRTVKQLPVGQISFASRYKDSDSDLDNGFSSDNQDLLDSADEYYGHTQVSQAYMSDPELDAEEREVAARREAVSMTAKDDKKRKRKKKSTTDTVPDTQEDPFPEESPGGGLMQLLTGKRMVKDDITEQELSSLASLSQTRKVVPLNLPKPDFRTQKTAVSSSQGASDSQSQSQSQSRAELPNDWSLKINISMMSRGPYTSAAALDEAGEASCLETFVQHGGETDLQPDETIQSSLYHWVFPAERPPPTHVALMAKVLAKVAEKNAVLKEHEQLELEYFQRCEQTWKEAFQSAYTMLRKNKLDYFYYLNSQFSVLFYHKDTGLGVTTCSAVMSTSTSGLRKQLDAEDIGFLVVMPKQSTTTDKAVDPGSTDGSTQETPAAGDTSPIRERSLPDPSTQTYPLRFDGSANVYRLFEFLLRWTEQRTDRRAEQMPTLLSLGPFLHAQIKSAKIVKHEKVRYNIQSSVIGSSSQSSETPSQSSKVETWHKLVIDGYVLPTAVTRLMATFRTAVIVGDLDSSQAEGGEGGVSGGLLTGTLRSHERTLGLNLAISNVAEDIQDGSGKAVATIRSVQMKGRGMKWK
ncbi:hypothetical protein HDU87_006136 [Geranomyces variabilis]|uniref:Uncharacterized protein n=1 Tax=Geranomyces variabilis TaxID=109894 RepID=A0AAD5TI65_9FUNG|nr:hypothetical protein HDU87_006136 [Geranomyces variabilis]